LLPKGNSLKVKTRPALLVKFCRAAIKYCY